jgi:DNA-3-methyladenine glycosylase I
MVTVTPGLDGRPRCVWATSTPLYTDYHDSEWGFPVSNDNLLFEKICLEGFQSGLSWLTILRKREDFRRVFSGFDIDAVAAFGADDVERLLGDPSIVRHRGKIEATINNAGRTLGLISEFGTFSSFVWQFEPAESGPDRATSPESVAMAAELKRRGFRFVGPTTAYAFMQAMGLVNDHRPECWAWARAEAARTGFTRPTL